MNNNNILKCLDLCKTYYDGNEKITVLNNVSMEVTQASRIAITGPSGSGKSTLLHLIGGLDVPSAGSVTINGFNWQHISEKARCELRNKHLGFIYQFHHLLPEFSALENVAMPLLFGSRPVKEAKQRAKDLLCEVGLEQRFHHKPAQLSGGERQRVAIARALVHEPKYVLADEPTGNLDQTTAKKVFEKLLELNQKIKTALIIVTHDVHLAQQMQDNYVLGQGSLKISTSRGSWK